ncbi:CCA tRNA nucleotidyltransferase [Peribacillus sp. NPDC096379]|uniref:CCA tRNA nucleotidyltransferase n=1 Tax=Peribacillus sp. NPDC096379 TaxID=3364393 RepID=UPI0038295089
MDQLFTEAIPVIAAIEEAGYEAYFVGGSVRDSLTGRLSNDVDIATSATPDEVKAIFPKTVDVGIAHGTILVLHESGNYEVTTFRTESGYSDFRRPDEVNFVRSLREDLQRRDFTMNAIAMDRKGKLIDPFGGKEAIQKKEIVTVGNPDERFTEDGLRMMRAIRFVSQLSFKLNLDTYASLKKHVHLMEHISVERILVEFEKLLLGVERKKSMELVVDSYLYDYLPGFKSYKSQLERVGTYSIEELKNIEELWGFLLVLLDIENIESFLRNWKMPMKNIRFIQSVVRLVKQDPSFLQDKFLLFKEGEKAAVSAASVRAVLENTNVKNAINTVKETYKNLIIKSMSELALTGHDLLAWTSDRKPGPWVKEAMDGALQVVLTGKVANDKVAIKEWLNTCNLM